MSDVTGDDRKQNRVNAEIFRLITPALIAVVGYFTISLVADIRTSINTINSSFYTLNGQVSSIKTELDDFKERVKNDEERIDSIHKK